MVKILLSCDAVDFDIALTLKATFQEKFGFEDVFLEVASWEGQENEDQSLAFDEDFDNKLEGAAVLLVFEFGETSISAWVMLEETDERNIHKANPRKKLFPEIIDFDKGYSRGIRIFERILKDDFGLVNTRRRRPTKHVEHYHHSKGPASSVPQKRRQVVFSHSNSISRGH